jgi:hypothetical protein
VAIALWKRGEAATKQATSAHDQAVANADAQNKAAVADGTSGAAQVAPFSDPGEALRKQAREMLDRARKQLKAAGDTAAGRSVARPRRAPPRPRQVAVRWTIWSTRSPVA